MNKHVLASDVVVASAVVAEIDTALIAISSVAKMPESALLGREAMDYQPRNVGSSLADWLN
jgi:hypothetical protein